MLFENPPDQVGKHVSCLFRIQSHDSDAPARFLWPDLIPLYQCLMEGSIIQPFESFSERLINNGLQTSMGSRGEVGPKFGTGVEVGHCLNKETDDQ